MLTSTQDTTQRSPYDDLKDRFEYTPDDALAEWARDDGSIYPDVSKLMVERARPHLQAFCRNNSDLSPERLEEIASALSPGGAHTGGYFIRILRHNMLWPDPLLTAAVIWCNWHGGKVGFQFLPDPARTEKSKYTDLVYDLAYALEEGTDYDPRRILTGKDRTFYDSLPDRFTIYRGVSGISADMAELGLCWTTQRHVAEWFARRWANADNPALVLTARCRKSDVLAAKASEFEIVTQVDRSKSITVRPSPKVKPDGEWKAAA